ncbi:hypothetical protein, partial [Reyranella sp.]|uniref:hypothetical protein n=1 Tax=Reyranella sp. TaxID=1929291 RepID=UPI0040375866
SSLDLAVGNSPQRLTSEQCGLKTPLTLVQLAGKVHRTWIDDKMASLYSDKGCLRIERIRDRPAAAQAHVRGVQKSAVFGTTQRHPRRGRSAFA